jgi:hypothetical protein
MALRAGFFIIFAELYNDMTLLRANL